MTNEEKLKQIINCGAYCTGNTVNFKCNECPIVAKCNGLEELDKNLKFAEEMLKEITNERT